MQSEVNLPAEDDFSELTEVRQAVARARRKIERNASRSRDQSQEPEPSPEATDCTHIQPQYPRASEDETRLDWERDDHGNIVRETLEECYGSTAQDPVRTPGQHDNDPQGMLPAKAPAFPAAPPPTPMAFPKSALIHPIVREVGTITNLRPPAKRTSPTPPSPDTSDPSGPPASVRRVSQEFRAKPPPLELVPPATKWTPQNPPSTVRSVPTAKGDGNQDNVRSHVENSSSSSSAAGTVGIAESSPDSQYAILPVCPASQPSPHPVGYVHLTNLRRGPPSIGKDWAIANRRGYPMVGSTATMYTPTSTSECLEYMDWCVRCGQVPRLSPDWLRYVSTKRTMPL